MKSLLKYVYIGGLVTISLMLTACNSQPTFDATLDNGSAIAIQTDNVSLTNQEVFELVAGGYINWENPGLLIILDWMDYLILSPMYEVDESVIEAQMETILESFDEDFINDIVISQGFETLEDYMFSLRVNLLRDEAIISRSNITDEVIEARYALLFLGDDEDEDSDEDLDEEARLEFVMDSLREDALSSAVFRQDTLAQIRYEAGLTFYSSYFATRYEDFLASWRITDVDVETGRGRNNIIATIDSHELTADELFETVVLRFAIAEQSTLLDYLDLQILNEMYEVSNREVRDSVSQAKVNFLDQFYPMMEAQGLFTEQQIFDAFLLAHLHELLLEDRLETVSEERLLEMFDEHIEFLTSQFDLATTPQRAARHILVDDLVLALELTARLHDVEGDEFEDLFAELAVEYSTCPSAASGGDLGMFGFGQMVPEFNNAVFNALSLYEFTPVPVETDFGFHIIYLYDIEDFEDEGNELTLPTFESLRDALEQSEIARMNQNPLYFSRIMFDIREEQNIVFTHPFLQLQYDNLRHQMTPSFDE